MPLTGFEVLTSVMCEEVRQEASGRALILGAMAHGPSISDEDKTKIHRLALYLEIQMPSEKIDLQFRLKKKDQEDSILYADVDTSDFYEKAPNPETWARNPIAVVIMGREDFEMSGSGDYYLQYSIRDDDWVDYKSIYFPPEGEVEVS